MNHISNMSKIKYVHFVTDSFNKYSLIMSQALRGTEETTECNTNQTQSFQLNEEPLLQISTSIPKLGSNGWSSGSLEHHQMHVNSCVFVHSSEVATWISSVSKWHMTLKRLRKTLRAQAYPSIKMSQSFYVNFCPLTLAQFCSEETLYGTGMSQKHHSLLKYIMRLTPLIVLFFFYTNKTDS